jgi:GAF domain-containing protein
VTGAPDQEPLRLDVALRALRAAARRSVAARHLQGDAETALLRSVVDAAVTLFDAEASSIALFERDPDRLEFRVAAGERGAGVIGLSVPPTKGIVGYVFSTSQPIALSDVMSDPRFDKGTAQRTGYVPRSIAAVPLIDAGATIGVLQVLDKRSSPTFTLRDMELLAVFARQAAAAIEATKVQRDSTRLLRAVLQGIGDGELDDEQLEVLLSAAASDLDREDESPFWQLVDQVSRLRSLTDRELALVAEILEVVGRHRSRPTRRGYVAADRADD